MFQPMGLWHHWMDQPFLIPLLSLTIAAPSFPFLELGFICSHLTIICISIICPIFVFFNGLEICCNTLIVHSCKYLIITLVNAQSNMLDCSSDCSSLISPISV